jgi:hypothetical protein
VFSAEAYTQNLPFDGCHINSGWALEANGPCERITSEDEGFEPEIRPGCRHTTINNVAAAAAAVALRCKLPSETKSHANSFLIEDFFFINENTRDSLAANAALEAANDTQLCNEPH